MSIYHCTQCGTNYGPKGSCPSCGRIGSRVSEFKMEPPKTFEAEILAAHPESGGIPGAGKAWEVTKLARWDLAMKLVGERHEKAELVRLVNWLLAYRDGAQKVRLALLQATGSLGLLLSRQEIKGGAGNIENYNNAKAVIEETEWMEP